MRLIAIQESVEIMKGADWSIVRNNTVHRRRLDRFPHGGSRFTAQFSQLPQIAKIPLAAACSARMFRVCESSRSTITFPTYHEDVISALYPSIRFHHIRPPPISKRLRNVKPIRFDLCKQKFSFLPSFLNSFVFPIDWKLPIQSVWPEEDVVYPNSKFSTNFEAII